MNWEWIMIEYNPPPQTIVNIGDYISNIGTVLNPSGGVMKKLNEKELQTMTEAIKDEDFQKYQNYNYYLKRNPDVDLPIHSDLTKADLWTIISQQEQEINNLWKRIDSLIDLLKDACTEGNDAIKYWKKNYNDALNSAIGYKNSCIEWKHWYEELQQEVDLHQKLDFYDI